jgi:hypothetical protein
MAPGHGRIYRTSRDFLALFVDNFPFRKSRRVKTLRIDALTWFNENLFYESAWCCQS